MKTTEILMSLTEPRELTIAANLTYVRSPGHNTCIDYVISLILFLLYYIDIHVYVE